MLIDELLEQYPKTIALKGGLTVQVRPLKALDESPFHQFFLTIPETERLLFKHRVTDLAVIQKWCHGIDYGRILPLLALDGDKTVAVASLHQTLGGWKRHIGRISVVVQPDYRGRGLARALLKELIAIARDAGLEDLTAEFMGDQQSARHVESPDQRHRKLSAPGWKARSMPSL